MTSIINSSIHRAVTQLRRACAVGDATLALETIVKAVPDYDASDAAVKAARLASLRVSAPSTRGSGAVA